MAKNNNFPTTIYVRREKDGDTEYLVADESLEAAIDEDGTMIGCYQLTGTKKGRVRRTLE